MAAMDVLALNPKSGGPVWGAATKRLDKGLLAVRRSAGWRVLGGEEEVLGFGGGLEIRVSGRRAGTASSLRFRSLVVRATGKKKNHDNSSSSSKGLFFCFLWGSAPRI